MRRRLLIIQVACLLLFLLISLTKAEKDGDYYLPGFTNPNALNEMYWKDSINVLQDLDQFEALYVTYHGCVWSKYGSRYGSGQNYDEQGHDQPDDDNYQNGCGGFGGEYFWYMGRTQCFKANVAFALYGVLKGSTNTGCTKDTFINGFFTAFGAESFAGPLGLGVNYGTSQCNSQEPQNKYLDSLEAAADDDYLDDKIQFYDYQAYTSTGTGCSADKTFVTDSYTGAFCHGQNYVETIDTLSDFNDQLRKMVCTQIYDGTTQPTQYDNDGDYNFAKMNAIDLLSFSKSCSLRQYPNDCPDPHGIKRKYAQTITTAFYLRTGGNRDIARKVMGYVTYVFAAMGVLFLILACVIRQRMVGTTRKRPRRTMSFSGNSSTTSSSSGSRLSKQERRRMREAKREARLKDNKRRSRSTTPKILNRGQSRNHSQESSRSPQRSASLTPGSSNRAVDPIGSVWSGQTYQPPPRRWNSSIGRRLSLSPTRSRTDVTMVKTGTGTVNIVMAETIHPTRSWVGDNDDNERGNRTPLRAGNFPKLFRSTSQV